MSHDTIHISIHIIYAIFKLSKLQLSANFNEIQNTKRFQDNALKLDSSSSQQSSVFYDQSVIDASTTSVCSISLQWRHNAHNGVLNHQSHDSLLNRLFRRRSKEKLKVRVTGLCEWNSPGTGEFPAQRASNAENVSISWRHHVYDNSVLDASTTPVCSICSLLLRHAWWPILLHWYAVYFYWNLNALNFTPPPPPNAFMNNIIYLKLKTFI